jgi:hypothetical protein
MEGEVSRVVEWIRRGDSKEKGVESQWRIGGRNE